MFIALLVINNYWHSKYSWFYLLYQLTSKLKVLWSEAATAGAQLKRCSYNFFFHISQGNTCVGVSFNKLTGLKACNFIKKRLQHMCFSVKFAKFLRRILKKNYFDEYRQATASILFAFILSHSYNSSYDFIKINFLNCRSSCPEEFSKKTDFIKK